MSNIRIGAFFWALSIFIGCFLSTKLAIKFFGFDHWFYFSGVSFAKRDIFGSLLVGLCFAFRDLSQIYFEKYIGKQANILLQFLLVALICTSTVVMSDPLIKIAATTAWAASLTTDLVVFNICKSKSYGWRIIWSSVLAASIDIMIYNALVDDVGIITPVLINFSDFLFKTCPSVIIAVWLDRKYLLQKLKRIKL